MARRLIAYFIRHGETGNNAAGLFRGQKDVPLNDNGVNDAQELIKDFHNVKLSKIYSSPMQRTRFTAQGVADDHGMKIQLVPALKPLNVGYLSGQIKSEHANHMQFFQNNPNQHIPGGDSIDSFRERTQRPIKSIVQAGANSNDPVAAFVHSSIIHELSHIFTGDHTQTLVKPGGIVGVYHDPKEGVTLRALKYPATGEGDTKYHG